MKIGELAKQAGCKVVTIHYYEKKGLMPAPERTQSNYREYDKKDLERLNFIRHCRSHGMSLDEIAQLLLIARNPENMCSLVHPLLEKHIRNVERQIAELQKLKDSLEVIRGQCEGEGGDCSVLKSLGNFADCAYCSHNCILPECPELKN